MNELINWSILSRELSWDDLVRLRDRRRDLLKASLLLRSRFRRCSRGLDDSLRLAKLAFEGFMTYFEVIRSCGVVRELRMRLER